MPIRTIKRFKLDLASRWFVGVHRAGKGVIAIFEFFVRGKISKAHEFKGLKVSGCFDARDFDGRASFVFEGSVFKRSAIDRVVIFEMVGERVLWG